MPAAEPDYEFLELLGSGGSARVHLVQAGPGGPRRVLKRVRLTETSDWTAARIDREVEFLQAVRHPRLVELVDVHRRDGEIDLVYTYVPGKNLEDRTPPAHGLPWRDAVLPLADALDALQALHQRGILHRDLKPANILMTDEGRGILLDLGLGFDPEEAERLTRTGQVACTPQFAAPEVFRLEPATASSDLYSMGVTAFYALTGWHPFPRARGVAEIAKAVTSKEAPDPRQRAPRLPAALAQLVMQLMDRDPANRPPDAGSAQARLLAILEAEGAEEAVTEPRVEAAQLAAGVGMGSTAVAAQATPPPRGGSRVGAAALGAAALAAFLTVGFLLPPAPGLAPEGGPPAPSPGVAGGPQDPGSPRPGPPGGAPGPGDTTAARVEAQVSAFLDAWVPPGPRDPLTGIPRLAADPKITTARRLLQGLEDPPASLVERLRVLADEARSMGVPPVLATLAPGVGPRGPVPTPDDLRARWAGMHAAPPPEEVPGFAADVARRWRDLDARVAALDEALRVDPVAVGGPEMASLKTAAMLRTSPPDTWWFVLHALPSPPARTALHDALLPLVHEAVEALQRSAWAIQRADRDGQRQLAEVLGALVVDRVEAHVAALAFPLLYLPVVDLFPCELPQGALAAARLRARRAANLQVAGSPTLVEGETFFRLLDLARTDGAASGTHWRTLGAFRLEAWAMAQSCEIRTANQHDKAVRKYLAQVPRPRFYRLVAELQGGSSKMLPEEAATIARDLLAVSEGCDLPLEAGDDQMLGLIALGSASP